MKWLRLMISICLMGLISTEDNFYHILGVSVRASTADIKRAYRQLALELHPDKLINMNLTETEREAASQRFLVIQAAYETLGDKALRTQYDYSLSGVQYDIVNSPKFDRYTSQPFSTFLKTPNMKFHFSAKFKRQKIPDLLIVINVDFPESLKPMEKKHTYFRRKLCPVCNGMGGVCRQCELCSGSGTAKHFGSGSESGVSMEHFTETACAKCKGTGCVPTSKCASCDGSGYIMEEETVEISLPRGFRNGYQISQKEQGHEDLLGGVGKLVVKAIYNIPEGWTLVPDTGDLIYNVKVPVPELLHGYSRPLRCPYGEEITVSVPSDVRLDELLSGVDIVGEGMGTIVAQDGRRAMLKVHIEPDWTNMTAPAVANVLEISGLKPTDTNFHRFMKMFFPNETWADFTVPHISGQEEVNPSAASSPGDDYMHDIRIVSD